MAKRTLVFEALDEAADEAERLQRSGYTMGGKWDLSQICDHVAYGIESSIEPKTDQKPVLFFLRWLGPLVLKQVLASGQVRDGAPTPLPSTDHGRDPGPSVERLRTAIQRYEAYQGDVQRHVFFGKMTRDQWTLLHRIHCAHHLSFLHPK